MSWKAATTRALLLATLASACTHAPWHPNRGWRVIHTSHFDVVTDSVLEPTTTIDHLERAHAALASSFFSGGAAPPRSTAFHLRTSTNSPMVAPSGAYRHDAYLAPSPALPGLARRGLIVIGDAQDEGQAAHTVAHHFVATAFPRAPAWFHEGAASFFGSFRFLDAKLEQVCFGAHNPGALARQRIVVKTSALYATAWGDFDRDNPEWIENTGHALFDLLVAGEGGRFRPALVRFLGEVQAGANVAKAFAVAYPELADSATVDRLIEAHQLQLRNLSAFCPVSAAVPGGVRWSTQSEETVAEPDIAALRVVLHNLPHGWADWYPPPPEGPSL